MDIAEWCQNIQRPACLQKTYQLGHTTFSCEIIFDSKLTQFLKEKRWDIEFYSAYSWNKIPATWALVFGHILTTQSERLQIKCQLKKQSFRNLPLFLPIIVSIHFLNLQQLCLTGLYISSLEPLAFLNMENLKILQLQNNNITIMKSLNKQKWAKLESLFLFKNNVTQIQIHRAQMAHKLNNLNLDFYTHIKFLGYNHTIQLHDISKLVKLEPLRIKGIYLTEVDEEILQPKVTEKFRNRFPDVDILSKEIYRIWI